MRLFHLSWFGNELDKNCLRSGSYVAEIGKTDHLKKQLTFQMNLNPYNYGVKMPGLSEEKIFRTVVKEILYSYIFSYTDMLKFLIPISEILSLDFNKSIIT
jgi:hypothetical protein